jgi:hypothetical protein
MASTARLHHPLALQPTTSALDRGGGMTLLVWLDSDYDHSRFPFRRWPLTRRQRTGLSGGVQPRSHQVTLALLGRRRATERVLVKPSGQIAILGVSPPPAPSLTGASVVAASHEDQPDIESDPMILLCIGYTYAR